MEEPLCGFQLTGSAEGYIPENQSYARILHACLGHAGLMTEVSKSCSVRSDGDHGERVYLPGPILAQQNTSD